MCCGGLNYNEYMFYSMYVYTCVYMHILNFTYMYYISMHDYTCPLVYRSFLSWDILKGHDQVKKMFVIIIMVWD